MGIHTHQIKLDGMHLKLMQNINSSATDSPAHEIVVKELAGTAKNYYLRTANTEILDIKSFVLFLHLAFYS